jgi:hypothetical protein
MKNTLGKFYEQITADSLLSKQFESIVNKPNFSKLLVRLGAANGYQFTASEVETSIQENTASEQGEYICLPIGCWHKA